MSARGGVVVDRHGNVIEEDEDFDGVVPDGGAVRIKLPFMDGLDAIQRAVARDTADADDANPYPVSDEQRARVEDAYLARNERLGAGMHRHRVPTPASDDVADGADELSDEEQAERRRSDAYLALKRRLHTAGPARRAPKPVDPSWLK
jgi:hypothetical protein